MSEHFLRSLLADLCQRARSEPTRRRRQRVSLRFEQLETRKLLATVSVQSGDWGDPNTWTAGVPDASQRAIISDGDTVTLAGNDHNADEIVVHGVLDVAEDANPRTLTADWIHVNSGGVFQIGTEANRFDTSTFVVTLTGTDITADHVIETATGTMNVNSNDGFLMTAMGGRLQFFGADKVTFTKLAATVESGATTITVANIIERNYDGTTSAASDGELSWEVGDEIVIASSSYDYAEEEVRTVTAVNNTGTETILTLDAALNHRHYGEIETYGNGVRTWDIDLRAEVALLSRSITIQGTQDTDNEFGDRANYGSAAGQNLGLGAQTMVMPGSGQVTVDGVRIDKGGQTGRLGRYPMHWHEAGDRTGDILRNSSITNSNNRGVTFHGTQGVLVEGNVLHDIHGHGFFMEDAVETDIQFLHNIALGIHKVGGGFTSTDPFVVPGITRGADGKVNGEAPRGENGESSHDTGQNAKNRFVHSAAYWITNPDNTWIGNIAAGSEGTGFWFALPTTALGLSKDTGLYDGLNPLRTNLLQFDHNTAHSSQIGLTFDRGEDIMAGTSNNNFSPPQTMQINNLTAYKNHGTAVYQRASVGIFNESRFADNAFSSFNTFNQEEHNILFVGHSRGNAEPDTLVGGYRLYDGPGRIVDSHFAGFAADNAHAFRIEGGANKFSHTRAEGISFEDDGTADSLGIELYGNSFLSVDQSPTFVAGRPDSISGLVYDVDGSLTGHAGGGPGYVLTPKLDFYRDSTDVAPAGWNGYLSDDRFAQFRIGRIADRDYIPPFRISNGDGHSIVADRWNLTYVQRMYTKVNAGDYTVEFLSGIPADGFDINLDIKQVSQTGDATVFRFVDVGRNYKPDRGTEVTSLNALRSAGSSSWFRAADGDLWMKIRESGTTIKVQPTTSLVVSNTNDSGAGSLRAAIDAANATSGFDTITFDIGTSGSTHTIQLLTPLPVITDRIYIDGSTQAPLPLLDGGFESPVQPANDWELANGSGNGNLAGSQWTITGGAGIARNLSAWQAGAPGKVPAPEGQQLAVIQGNGSFSQTVSGFEVGQTYELSLLAMGRQTNNLGGDLTATLDVGLATETALIDIPEVMFTRFTEVNSTSFVATKNSYTLTIQSDQNIGDTLFDDVTFRLVSPPIVIDGSVAGGSAGLEFTVPGGVQSLTVNGFASGAGIQLSGTGGSFVDRVWSGVDATGTTAAPNRFGIRAESDGNTIRNSLLSGNELAGIRVLNADDNIIMNNLIGTDPSGTTALPNGGDGVELRTSNGATVTGNVIAFNGEDGVLVVDASIGNTISNNSIFSNAQLGIDLGNDGVTPNDSLDADTGANDLTNFPVLTGAAAIRIPAHILFQDNFDDAVSTSLDDPSARATGLLADLVKYDFPNVDAGEVAVTGGLLDWTGTNIDNGNLETGNGNQNWTFRTSAGGNTHFDWAPYLAGDIYEISFTYRSAWTHPLTFGISDTPQPGHWDADTNGSYDYAFGAWGRNWDSGEDGNTTRTSGGAGDTEFYVLLKIDETAGTAEAWVDGTLISTESIDFEYTGRYFSFGEPKRYGGYIDDFTVFVIPAGTTTTIVGEMSGVPNTVYDVELFSSSQLDPSGYGEGRTLIGSTTVTTDASGTIGFNTTLEEGIPLGEFITATATHPTAGTSEFSEAITVTLPDYGDAPSTYPVTVADDGAGHVAVGPRLGDARDGESDGQPTSGANGDDTNGDDEDGVLFGSINVGSAMATVNIDLQNATSAWVDAWLDFDGNGSWEADEKILDGVLATDVAGFETFNFSINADAIAGDTYARVRVSSAGGLDTTGLAFDGEVEDYLVSINPIPVKVEDVTFNAGSINRSGMGSIAITFSEAVNFVGPGSIRLFNHSTSTLIDTTSITPTGDGTTVLTWDLTSITFPDGRYTAELVNIQVEDLVGLPLKSSYAFELHVLSGDVDGDAQVNFNDYFAISANFNQSGAAYRPGDADGDGLVNFNDYFAVSANFNANLGSALGFDFGDAPESANFPTLLSPNDGARHVITGNTTFLGALRDAESDGQPTADATGDGADEDGIAVGNLIIGSNVSVTVTAGVPSSAYLNAWVDFNQDGDWDDVGEQIFTDEVLTNGANALAINVPGGATVGSSIARFRITESPGYSYVGLAPNGEVEDYQFSVVAAKGFADFGDVFGIGTNPESGSINPDGVLRGKTLTRVPVTQPGMDSAFDLFRSEDKKPERWHQMNSAVLADLAGSTGDDFETTKLIEPRKLSRFSAKPVAERLAIDDAFTSDDFDNDWMPIENTHRATF